MSSKPNGNKACIECGGALNMCKFQSETRVGNIMVLDDTRQAPTCVKCDEPQLTLDDIEGYELRAAALILHNGTHVNGDVIRYARRALGLRQTELADMFQCTIETVSRWETGAAQMSRANQLALVSMINMRAQLNKQGKR